MVDEKVRLGLACAYEVLHSARLLRKFVFFKHFFRAQILLITMGATLQVFFKSLCGRLKLTRLHKVLVDTLASRLHLV